MGVIEAEAACLPIVATDGPGTREAMQSGLTGFLVPVANPQALAAAMARVMAMPPSARHEMGARGRQFVAEHFSLSSVVDRWEVLYAQLLSAHPAPSRRA
jgi:glycosyltransferase involved in cell wall biosynthesis